MDKPSFSTASDCMKWLSLDKICRSAIRELHAIDKSERFPHK